FDETEGASCASRVPTPITCLYPAAQITRGQPGIGGTTAVRLDAASATLTVAGLSGDLGAPYSIELWLRLDTVAPKTKIADFAEPVTSSPGDGLNLFLWDAAELRTELWRANKLIAYGVGRTSFAAGAWHHVVITHATGPHRDLLYVDGVL